MHLYMVTRLDIADYDELRFAAVVATDQRTAIALVRNRLRYQSNGAPLEIPMGEVPPHSRWSAKPICDVEDTGNTGVVCADTHWG